MAGNKRAAGRAVTSEDADSRRTDLAQMIFLAQKSGLPPERIKEAVLAAKVRSLFKVESLCMGIH